MILSGIVFRRPYPFEYVRTTFFYSYIHRILQLDVSRIEFPFSYCLLMPLFAFLKRHYRIPVLVVTGLFFSLLALAQVNLKYRLLSGYSLSADAPVNKGKTTLFVFEQAETFGQVFQLAPNTPNKKHDAPNFDKEMAIGIALSPTKTPPRLSISKVFVQDSTLTVRYIRMADTTLLTSPLSEATAPTLLVTIPKQTVLKTRLIENGKVVQTLKKRDD